MMITEKLKTGTAENHRLVEESGLMSPITNRSVTVDSYKHILIKFYGFFSPIERILSNFPELIAYLPDFYERRKTSALLEDLNSLGSGDGNLMVCDELPTITNLSHAFGCLYVMEGSTLGGRVISRILKETLAIDESCGAKFFTGYGAETGIKWKAFQEAVTKYSTVTNDDEGIVTAANAAFYKFKHWIDL